MALSVSVLVPCFNAGHWLTECVESVRLQSFPALEIIVVDDGSDEAETLDILKAYKNVSGIRVLRKSNGGVSSARNAALDVAKGDYVLFLDADDYLEANALGAMVAAAESTGAVFVGAGWRAVDEYGHAMHSTAPGTSSGDYYAAAVTNGVAPGGVLNKRRLDIRFNDTMPWEAMEYYLDYLSHGEKVIFIDDIVVNRRQSDRPERLTNKLDHFEPMRMGTFFVDCKDRLLASGAASDERFAALDNRILNCIHSLLYANRYADATILARSVSRNLLGHYARYRLGSFAWFFKWGGIRAASFFMTINRLIGR
jgi:glycosyltransferase involved in cell wall biosynthesis